MADKGALTAKERREIRKRGKIPSLYFAPPQSEESVAHRGVKAYVEMRYATDQHCDVEICVSCHDNVSHRIPIDDATALGMLERLAIILGYSIRKDRKRLNP